MSMVTFLLKLLVLVALILNGTAAHGIHMLIDPATDSSYSKPGSQFCHSAADHGGSVHDALQDSGTNSAGDVPTEHDCGGAGCTCACLNHTPPLASFGTFLRQLASAPSIVTSPRVSFHSLTPLPLLRPPIG